MDDRLKLIADHFGLDNQLSKLQEELSELIRAIAKIKSLEEITQAEVSGVVEEIADVEILIEQIKYLTTGDKWGYTSHQVRKCREFKLQRTISRYKIGGL